VNRDNIDKFITEALVIEAEEAKKAGMVGFVARALTMATLPHKAVLGCEFTRQNGLYTLSILAPSKIGLPYGSIPRLLLSWVTTEAVRTRSPVLELGPTLSDFMAELGYTPTGGEKGDITRLRNQMTRLFSSSISCIYDDKSKTRIVNVNIAEEACLWWNPKTPDQLPLWKSTITLGSGFFKEIIEKPVPIDIRALKLLKRSPMALDIYCWLTHRLFYLQKPVEIPWAGLQLQFGADYTRERDFKAAFLQHLRAVGVVYPEAKVEEGERGLILKPSRPHVARMPELLPYERKQHKAAVARAAEQQAEFANSLFEPATRRLKTETFEKAKQAAPGFDVYYLEQEWREWIAKKGEQPKNPDAAFVGFCRRKAQLKTT